MQILAISGKRGSGKSLLAKCLAEYGFKTASLAHDLKLRAKSDFGLNDDQVYGIFKEQPTAYTRTDGSYYTPRDILIRMGCFYRSIDPLFWAKKVELHDKTVIDDIRFINEVKFFKEKGAKFIRLERLPELNCYKAALDDLSETELDTMKDWDFKIYPEQNKEPKDLEQFASYICQHLQK